jgi:hypothetical protein
MAAGHVGGGPGFVDEDEALLRDNQGENPRQSR